MTMSRPEDVASDSPDPTLSDLRREIEELRQGITARDEFISIVAHELRNPISPLFIQLACMREVVETCSDEISRPWLLGELTTLDRRLTYFLASLNRLLDASRIGEGNLDLRIEECDVVEIVRATVASFPEIKSLGIEVDIHAPERAVGDWDRMRLEQIVGNLCSNAIRYGLGRPITINIDVDQQDRVLISVRDRGVGIAESEQAHIFERFRRVASHRSVAGFGVGLWVVDQLCRALGGSVKVDSTLGEGATFTVCLPRRRAS
jgi:signal transduction histidine kinase